MPRKPNIIDTNISFLFASVRHTDVECVTHIHRTMEIVIVTDGVLNMTIGGKEYEIPKGDGVFISPLEPHMFHSETSNRCHVLMFSEELVNSFSAFVKQNAPRNHRFSVSELGMALVDKILPLESNTVDCISAEAVLAPLCYDISRECVFEARALPFDGTIYRIFEYINEHYREDMTLERVAHAVGVHPVTVSKLFAAHTGLGFSYYLQYLRCNYAARLIKQQELSFSEIAFAAGFGSIRSFNRSFFNIYKATPTQYRQMLVDLSVIVP